MKLLNWQIEVLNEMRRSERRLKIVKIFKFGIYEIDNK